MMIFPTRKKRFMKIFLKSAEIRTYERPVHRQELYLLAGSLGVHPAKPGFTVAIPQPLLEPYFFRIYTLWVLILYIIRTEHLFLFFVNKLQNYTTDR